MIKYLKFSEFAYLGLIIFSIYMAYRRWDIDRNNALLFLFFSVLLVILFYFKRRFRINYENRRKDQNQNEKK